MAKDHIELILSHIHMPGPQHGCSPFALEGARFDKVLMLDKILLTLLPTCGKKEKCRGGIVTDLIWPHEDMKQGSTITLTT